MAATTNRLRRQCLEKAGRGSTRAAEATPAGASAAGCAEMPLRQSSTGRKMQAGAAYITK